MKEVQKTIDVNANIKNIQCKIQKQRVVVSFDNLGYGTVTAVKFNAQAFNAFNDVVKINGREKFFFVFQDISVLPNCHCELKTALPNANIKNLVLEEYQTCYSDGYAPIYSEGGNREVTLMEFDENDDGKEMIDAIKEEFGNKIQYLPQEVEDGWICGCGNYNRSDTTICSGCRNQKDHIFKITNTDYVTDLADKYKQNQKDREREKQESKKRATKLTIRISIVVLIMLILAVPIGKLYKTLNRTTYQSEQEMKEDLQGKFAWYNENGDEYGIIIINDDRCQQRHKFSDELDAESVRNSKINWNPTEGAIYTPEQFIVTRDGNLKSDNHLYQRVVE